jgi:hypothetical protein
MSQASPLSLPAAAAERRLSLLLLCDDVQTMAATARQHIEALTLLSRHRVYRLSLGGYLPDRVDLDRFDGIIIHYSAVAALDRFLDERSQKRIAAYDGVKALFIQDEHRHVRRTIALLRRLGIGVLFTCVPASEVAKVYPLDELSGLHMESVLTGYVDSGLCRLTVPPLAARSIDVGYRARRLSAWLGQLGHEKWLIGQRFAVDADTYELVCDISWREEDRLYGRDWIDFLTRCKAVLGSESGSSVFDVTGAIERSVLRHELAKPETPFEALRDLYFRDEDGRVANGQISPRCFEAAALRTLMILYPGRYSGILEPWRHYVPLRKDHSNMAEVVGVLRDLRRAQEIVDHAYRDVAMNPVYSFAAHVSRVDSLLTAVTPEREVRGGYAPADWAALSRPDLRSRLRWWRRRMKAGSHRLLFAKVLGHLPPEERDRIHWRIKSMRRFGRERGERCLGRCWGKLG